MLLLITACGRENKLAESGATLEGTVTFKDEQLRFANISVSGEGRLASGRIDENGRYKVENCPIGEVKVGVNTQSAMGEYTSETMRGGAFKGTEAKGRGKVSIKMIHVPEKYFVPETSGLSTTVKAGNNTYDIVITK
jgi:hypothetical protein